MGTIRNLSAMDWPIDVEAEINDERRHRLKSTPHEARNPKGFVRFEPSNSLDGDGGSERRIIHGIKIR